MLVLYVQVLLVCFHQNSSATVNGDAGLQVTFEDIKDSNNESVQVSVPFSKIRSSIKEVNKGIHEVLLIFVSITYYVHS